MSPKVLNFGFNQIIPIHSAPNEDANWSKSAIHIDDLSYKTNQDAAYGFTQ